MSMTNIDVTYPIWPLLFHVSPYILGIYSPQVAAVMWVMTYVGAIFNGITLVIIGGSMKCVNNLNNNLKI